MCRKLPINYKAWASLSDFHGYTHKCLVEARGQLTCQEEVWANEAVVGVERAGYCDHTGPPSNVESLGMSGAPHFS